MIDAASTRVIGDSTWDCPAASVDLDGERDGDPSIVRIFSLLPIVLPLSPFDHQSRTVHSFLKSI